MGNISEYDMYLFGAGVHYDMYMKLGAHPCKKGRWQGVNCCLGTERKTCVGDRFIQ